MREYTIRKMGAGWDDVPALEIDNVLWLEDHGIRASAKIAYDDEAMYVQMRAVEKEIRAEGKGIEDMPCEDSCLEFFFSPVAGDPRYINIEFNPNTCVYLGIATNRYDILRLFPQPEAMTPVVSCTEDGWMIEYKIPFTMIRTLFPSFDPAEGAEIRANCYKCGDLTTHEHYLSWNPSTSETPDFHRPQDFGRMIFG